MTYIPTDEEIEAAFDKPGYEIWRSCPFFIDVEWAKDRCKITEERIMVESIVTAPQFAGYHYDDCKKNNCLLVRIYDRME